KVVEDSRKTANKYSVLDSLPEDNDQELQMLMEIMIVDNFLDKKMQPIVNVAIPWSKDKGGIAQDMEDNVINGWDNNDTCVQFTNVTNQSLFCVIYSARFQYKCFYTFVSAANDGIKRRRLYNELINKRRYVNGKPWCVAGDMNVTLSLNEHSYRGSVMTADTMKFQDCINKIEVDDLCKTRLHFTWKKNLHKTKAETRLIAEVYESENDEEKVLYQLNERDVENMIHNITDVKIKNAMFDIDDYKALGPDGFIAAFFKKKLRGLLVVIYAKL
nr:RNA-directed DNA polymerase, eukaryota, reverse transcriptase zinc-binding domain protein [Tanacetum cinerariifolium]